MRIGIIAALPGELKPLVRNAVKLPTARGSGVSMWQWERDNLEAVAVCAGMGVAAARRAFTAAEHMGALDEVISVGWAGALQETAVVGRCYVIEEIVDAQTGERFGSAAADARLVTTPTVANGPEKRRLAAAYGALLVDMEAATVARLAEMRRIPWRCFKAVSDGLNAELPDLNRFIDVHGKLRMAPFLAHVASHPRFWGPVLRLGSNSAAAAEDLATTLGAYLEVKAL